MASHDIKEASDNVSDIGSQESRSREGFHVRSRPWWKLGGGDRSFVTIDGDSTSDLSIKSDEESEINRTIHGTVFEDKNSSEIYQPPPEYEGAHRFDPAATWTPEEEQRLVRKVSVFGV
jgi:hypothetical protein